MSKMLKYHCKNCHEFIDGFMLFDNIWKLVTKDIEDCLCLKCTELKLGRKLTIQDFDFRKHINNCIFFGYRIGLRKGKDNAQM